MFTLNRFTNINVHVYYNTVWGRPLQLLDSQFGLTCLKHNHYTMQLETVLRYMLHLS